MWLKKKTFGELGLIHETKLYLTAVILVKDSLVRRREMFKITLEFTLYKLIRRQFAFLEAITPSLRSYCWY